ncbi:Rieske 2Fe-2S domain-containing protein [Herbiconiux sp. 11R-BC]
MPASVRPRPRAGSEPNGRGCPWRDRPRGRASSRARRAGRPVGISTVGGRTCAVSAVCPHLGGVLAWNDAELSWDCPLHASRFTASGARIEGPALTDLPVLPRTPSP